MLFELFNQPWTPTLLHSYLPRY